MQFPEDKEFCGAFIEEDACVKEKSMFDNDISRCRWKEDGINPGNFYCLHNEVEMSIQVRPA